MASRVLTHLQARRQELGWPQEKVATASRVAFARGANGQLRGRSPECRESKYLLAGLARCAVCGGTIHVRSRSHGQQRGFHYGCKAYNDRGTKICANGAVVEVGKTDAAIIGSLETAIMNPAVVERTAELVRDRIRKLEPVTTASRSALMSEVESNQSRIKNLVEFIATGVQSKAIVDELRQLESRQLGIGAQIEACDARHTLRLDDDLDAKIAAKIKDWQAVMAGNVPSTRVLLKKLLVGPIMMTALPDKRGYRFDGKIRLDELLPIGGAFMVASPKGLAPFSWADLLGKLLRSVSADGFAGTRPLNPHHNILANHLLK